MSTRKQPSGEKEEHTPRRGANAKLARQEGQLMKRSSKRVAEKQSSSKKNLITPLSKSSNEEPKTKRVANTAMLFNPEASNDETEDLPTFQDYNLPKPSNRLWRATDVNTTCYNFLGFNPTHAFLRTLLCHACILFWEVPCRETMQTLEDLKRSDKGKNYHCDQPWSKKAALHREERRRNHHERFLAFFQFCHVILEDNDKKKRQPSLAAAATKKTPPKQAASTSPPIEQSASSKSTVLSGGTKNKATTTKKAAAPDEGTEKPSPREVSTKEAEAHE